jgi:uncharacterized membrane protein
VLTGGLSAFNTSKEDPVRVSLPRLICAIAVLLILGWLLSSCGAPELDEALITSELGDLGLKVTMNVNALYIPPDVLDKATETPPVSGTLSITVFNRGSEDIEVDVWVDVLPGIRFEEGFHQRISDNGQRAMRSGVVMRPSENRTLDFTFELDDDVDPGLYVIEINASSSTEDLVTTTRQVEVKRQ